MVLANQNARYIFTYTSQRRKDFSNQIETTDHRFQVRNKVLRCHFDILAAESYSKNV